MLTHLDSLKSKFYQLLWRLSCLHRHDTAAIKFLRAFVYKKLNRKKIIIHCPFTTTFFNLKYSGDLYHYIDNRIYRFGAFEKHILFFIRDMLSKNPQAVFLDIGANVGQHSLFASQYAHTVHAFEPFTPLLDQFKKNRADNQIKNIHIHPVGFGSENAIKAFYKPPEKFMGCGSFLSDFIPDSNKDATMLTVVRGDEYLQQHGISSCELMKIDVEGYEKFVLLGLQNTLKKMRPVILMEITKRMNESFQSVQELKSLLPDDYDFYFIKRKTSSEKCGKYQLQKMDWSAIFDQADIIAYPHEKNMLCR